MKTNFGLRIEWDGVYTWKVFIPGRYKNQICGLCGNWDGDRSNDFKIRGGDIVSIYFDKEYF